MGWICATRNWSFIFEFQSLNLEKCIEKCIIIFLWGGAVLLWMQEQSVQYPALLSSVWKANADKCMLFCSGLDAPLLWHLCVKEAYLAPLLYLEVALKARHFFFETLLMCHSSCRSRLRAEVGKVCRAQAKSCTTHTFHQSSALSIDSSCSNICCIILAVTSRSVSLKYIN